MKKIYMILLLCAVKLAAQNITSAEYFIDNDPGLGNATPVTGVPQTPNANFSFTASHTQQSGTHVLGYRTKDANGKWSLTAFSTFNIVEMADTSPIQSLEYFWDNDAGFGNNLPYPLSSPLENVQDLALDLNVPADLSLGNHSIFIRSRDAHAYSHTNYKFDVVVTDAPLSTETFATTGISCYPNPIQNELNIVIANHQKSRLIIYNINGKQITDTVINDTATIDMSRLAAGIYTAYFWKDANKIYVVKLIKK